MNRKAYDEWVSPKKQEPEAKGWIEQGKHKKWILLAIAAFFILSGVHTYRNRTEPMPPLWEYKTRMAKDAHPEHPGIDPNLTEEEYQKNLAEMREETKAWKQEQRKKYLEAHPINLLPEK